MSMNANVVARRLEDGSYLYDCLMQGGIVRFECGDVRGAADLSDAINKYAYAMSVEGDEYRDYPGKDEERAPQ